MIKDKDDLDWTSEEEQRGILLREEQDATKVPYDLEERTARFGEVIIDFAKTVPVNPVTTRLISQLVGCGTSIGANYCEANDYVSANDFPHKVSICREAIARDAVFSTHDSAGEARAWERGAETVARGKGAEPDPFPHLAKRKSEENMTLYLHQQIFRISNFEFRISAVTPPAPLCA
jgi:hypothetical protein